MQWNKYRTGLALVLSLGLMSGCGGGGGTTASGGAAPLGTVSGTVADGYLSGAIVCLDINGNNQCDANEPTATTGAGGKYAISADELAKLGGQDPSLFPLVVEVPPTAVDEDTNQPVGKDYTLSAPAGKPSFVSPMTTLVQNQIATNPALSVDEAETTVKTQAGISTGTSLFQDYVDPQAQAGNAELAKVHQVAQVVTQTMAEISSTLQSAAGGSLDATTLDAINKVAVQEVTDRLTTIAGAVDTASSSGTAFDPSTVATTVTTEAPVDTSSLTQQIEEASTTVAKSSFETMMEDGTGTFWIDMSTDPNATSFVYGNVTLVNNNPVETTYVRQNGVWQADSSNQSTAASLTASGWQPFSDNPGDYTATFNADGTALLSNTTTNFQQKLSVAELDLSGKLQAAYAGSVKQALVDATATFPDGAKAYKMTFVPQEDVYRVDTWLDSNGVDQNSVRYWDNSQNQDVTVTTLDQVLSVFAAGSTNYLPIGNLGPNTGLVIQFGANGALNLFKQDWSVQGLPQTLDKTGSWQQTQVDGKTLLMLTIPDIYLAMLNNNGAPFLVVKDGVVKQGALMLKGVAETDKSLNFNKTAFDSLSANIDYSYQPATGGNTGTNTGSSTGSATPPATADTAAITAADVSGKTFLLQKGSQVGANELIAFGAGGSFSAWSPSQDSSAGGIDVTTGTWSIDGNGHLVLAHNNNGAVETITVTELTSSTAAALNVYAEINDGGISTSSEYDTLLGTTAFTDPSGLSLTWINGATVAFDATHTGSFLDSTGGAQSFTWQIDNSGRLVITMDSDGSTETLYLLAASPQGEFDVAVLTADANGNAQGVFRNLMSAASTSGTGGGGSIATPPDPTTLVALTSADVSGKTFEVQNPNQPTEVDLVTFDASGALREADSYPDATGNNQLDLYSGTWSIDQSGNLVLNETDSSNVVSTITVSKLNTSTATDLAIYYTRSQGGSVAESGYNSLLSTTPFTALSGKVLTSSDGTTLTFNTDGTTGTFLDSSAGSSPVPMTWSIAGDGSLSLAISGGQSVTVYLLSDGTTTSSMNVAGIMFDASQNVLDVFQNTMAVQ